MFGNSLKSTCENCTSPCKTCTTPDGPTICTTCVVPKFLNSNQCVDTCPVGKFG